MRILKGNYTSLLVASVLSAASLIAYSNTFNASFHYDDIISIVFNENVHMKEFSLGRLLSTHPPDYPLDRPLAWMTFAMNYYLGGLETFGYHLVNMVVHIFTGMGVYYLTKEIKDLACVSEDSRMVAFAAAMIWLLSPVQTESVTYIIQRMTSMSGMFYVLSILSYVRWRVGKGGNLLIIFSIILCIASLAAKQTAITIPAIIILFEFIFFTHDFKVIRTFKFISPFVIFSVLFFYMADLNPASMFKTGYAMQERLLTGGRIVIYYIGTLFFPIPSRLALVHDFQLSRGLLSPFSTLPSIGIVAALTAYSLFIMRREPFISFFSLWFLINILPETLHPKIELIYDHRLYVPSVGVYAIFIILLSRVLKTRVFHMLISLLCVFFLINTYHRNMVWHDDITLWSDNVKKSPFLSVSHEGLGRAYLNMGELEKAEDELKRAKLLDPLSSLSCVGLGMIYQMRGDSELAIKELEYVASRKRMGFDVYYHGMEGDMYEMKRKFLINGRPAEAEKMSALWNELRPEMDDIKGMPKLKITR